MKIDLEPSVISALEGPKFTVVLELAPGDPLQLVPRGVFDGYLALDPNAGLVPPIYPFPRPLSEQPRVSAVEPRQIPVIGSFGFATPGKGFETIVEAANQEFDRAIVRINIPEGDFIDTAFFHGRDYAAHLQEVCERIAKPGIEVRFSHELMSSEQLIDWCGENDLNCFFYTRCQPGLAATTDQAIICGRPLLTSSNDTFRHIHPYIPPYPLTTLRSAIETTRPLVRLIQRDWSKAAFNARFAAMLADFNILGKSDLPQIQTRTEKLLVRKILIGHGHPISGGLSDRLQRLANALGRTGEYIVSLEHVSNAEVLLDVVARHRPDAVLVSGIQGAQVGEVSELLKSFEGPIVCVDGALSAEADRIVGDGRVVETGTIPVAPYFTLGQGFDEDPSMWLIGFTTDIIALERMLRRAARELPGVRVRIQLLPDSTDADRVAVQAAIDAVPRVWAEMIEIIDDGDLAIRTFAGAKLILFKNVNGYTDTLHNQAELAMITERAVVFSREAPFPHAVEKALCFEDTDLAALAAQANAAQISLVHRFSEGAAFARFHRLLSPFFGDDEAAASDKAIDGQASYDEDGPASVDPPAKELASPRSRSTPAQERQENMSSNDVSNLDRADDIAFIEKVFRRHLGRDPDQMGLQHYLERLSSGKSRRKVERDIKRSLEARQHRRRQGGVPLSSAQELLALDGAEFVTKAYRMILGRTVDPTGLAHHVNLLKAGHPKQDIVISLYRSPERGATEPDLAGLDRVIRSYERNRAIPWRWFKRSQHRKVMSRSLGIAEHRMSVLEAQLAEERELRTALIAEMNEQVLRLESAVALAQMEAEIGGVRLNDPAGALLSYARDKPGTLFILAGQTGRPSVANSSYSLKLVQAALADGQAVRLVEWDATRKRILLAARETLQSGGWSALQGLPVNEYPPRGAMGVALDRESVDAKDWLVVGDMFRTPRDPAVLMEVDLIIESRRIGLENAFIFHGAGPLAGRNASREVVACHEQYMQALLLADVLVATSEHAMEELEHFLAVGQLADFTGPRTVVSAPEKEASEGWQGHVRNLSVALSEARSDAPYIFCNIVQPSPTDEGLEKFEGIRSLEEGFQKVGIPVHGLTFGNVGDALDLQVTQTGSSANAPTNWLLIPFLPAAEKLEHLIGAARSAGLRVAVWLSSGNIAAGSQVTRTWGDVLAKADRLICDDEAEASWLWYSLLSSRERFPCAEERIDVVPPPTVGDPAETAAYVLKIARLLANDLPRRRVTPLENKDLSRARALMPQMGARPKLSICISTYNRAKWLDKSLGNIFSQIAQPRNDLEVLVVDNCSTDETPQIGAKYQYRKDFIFIRNPVNVGMLGNLAVTAQRARGEYIWILGDDDLTRKGTIERVLALLNDHPQLELIYMNYGYTNEFFPENVPDLDAFLDGFNVLQPSCPDEFSTVAQIAAKTENFYTAIYSHVYRRDHGMRSYCQDTSGRIFATMRSCIPTTFYVLHYMAQSPAYWIGDQQIVVNSNVSWAEYGPMLELEHLPGAWDLAERAGSPVEQVDMRRANRLWLVKMMWRNLFENDTVGNADYVSPARTLMRLRHLPQFADHIAEFKEIYEAAHRAGNRAATLPPAVLFGAFQTALDEI